MQDHLPPPREAIALVRDAMAALADGSAELPPKPAVHPRSDGFANAMPAYLRDGDLLGLKWVASYPGNAARGLPTVNGLVVLSNPETGMPAAVMGAAALTGARTAAVSGACIDGARAGRARTRRHHRRRPAGADAPDDAGRDRP